jgi:hypothetical protein
MGVAIRVLHSVDGSAFEIVRHTFTANHSLHGDRRNMSTTVLKFAYFMVGFACVLIQILINVQVCDCAAYSGLFRKHFFNLTRVNTP